MAKHTYTSYNSGTMTLHIIKTHACNFKLVNLQSKNNLSGSGYLGINGGFFTFGKTDALNIAYTNGGVVGPKTTDGSRDNASYCGIFLDGSGSSQLRAKDANGSTVSVPGDGRKLCQIIALRDQN